MPTARISPAPIVLAIGCPPALVKKLKEAAIAGQALLAECDLENAATMAAQTRALVLVMLDDVYGSDGQSFSALAADVRARLVVVPGPEVSAADLESMIEGAILDAEAARDSVV